jgi:hypothetical protein
MGPRLGVMDKLRGLRDHPILCRLIFFLWGSVKNTVYKTPVTFVDERKLRIFAAIETVTPQMLEKTLGPKLHTSLTSYVPSEARMLKLFSIP